MSAPPRLDRCPGLLRPHLAADGALVRLRVPGGRVATATLADLVALGERFGAPTVQLTSRASLQVRALPDPLPRAFVEGVEATGLLPSATHERVRNVLASPLAPELHDLVRELDEGLVADPVLAELPGRFLFAVADESGSVLGERWDLAWQSTGDGDGVLLAGGRGRAVPRHEAVRGLLDLARAFVRHRPSAEVWQVGQLPAHSPALTGLAPYTPVVAPPLHPGAVGDDLVAGVPLGLLSYEHVAALATVAEHLVVTPWRSVVVPGGAAHAADLAAAGLVTDHRSAWARVSACTGAPACASGLAPTRDLAGSLVAALDRASLRPTSTVHVVGCDRRCGAHPGDQVVQAPAVVGDIVRTLAAQRSPA